MHHFAMMLPGQFDLQKKFKSASQQINKQFRLSGEPENRVALVTNKAFSKGDIICLMSGDLATQAEQYAKNNAHLMAGVILHPRILYMDCNEDIAMDCSSAAVIIISD